MNRSVRTAATAGITLVAALCAVVTATAGTATTASPSARAAATQTEHSCAVAPAGFANCDAQIVVDSLGRPASAQPDAVTGTPKGLGPAQLRSAYALLAAAGKGRTVAVVDAYNHPGVASDLAVYRKKFALPACTVANGCFRKVNQTGGSAMPRTDAGWATEISLDVEMVSAACPSCRILLVLATTSSMANLAIAVDYAATQHVSAISNSYSAPDSAPSPAYDHPGIAITASTGDNGYGVKSPASFDTVIAVGGTSLKKSATARKWTETAWSGAGSGCSKLNAKPSWQTAATKCAGKAVADVSAVADPNTGVAMYDSLSFRGAKGWQVYGGTSVASPIIAAVYTMSGRTAGYPAAYSWTHAGNLNDVKAGSNGKCPLATPSWCTARSGWDGATGLGTPKGTGGF
jgi:hypothetical protein